MRRFGLGLKRAAGARRRVVLGALLAVALVGCDGNENVEGGSPDAAHDHGHGDGGHDDGGHLDGGRSDQGRADLGPDAAATDAEPAIDAEPAEDPGAPLSGAEVMALADLFVGTGGQAFGYAAQTPAAQQPRGMVRLGPDTTRAGRHPDFHHFSGYHFDDPEVRGFAHTHFVGTGIADFGNLRVLPVPGGVAAEPGRHYLPKRAGSESASPGRYGVTLDARPGADGTPDASPGIRAELTATLRAGLHRYTPEAGGTWALQFDAASSVKDEGVIDAQITATAAGAIQGYVTYRGPLTGRERPFTLYFDAQTSAPPLAVASWDATGVSAEAPEGEAASAQGEVAGVALRFASAEPLLLAVGISYVDAEGARANRLTELGETPDFEVTAARAAAAWLPLFEAARFAGGDAADRANFATALYQTHTMPTRLDDVDGRYRGIDGEAHALPEGAERFAYYTDLSLWDTFRTLHPWYELVFPEVEVDVLRSLEAMGAQSGVFPRWPAAIGEGGSMIGSSADLLFAGGAAKNLLPDAFFAAQFDRILSSALVRREGYAEDTMSLGYVANDHHGGSVSLSVEFAYNDGMLADLAERLGRPEAEDLRTRSHYWRNHLNPESGFLEPRDADGSFKPRRFEQIFHSGGPYVEGSAWHWRFSAFHEPEALAEALGGPEALGAALGELFGQSWMLNDTYSATIPDPHYWHGNQPSLHAVWLWHTAGDRVALVDWLRNIQRIVYRPTPTGRPGNDDGGTMSAWYLFSAVGLYPVAGSDRYWLGAPILPRIELRTGPGRMLRIEAPGASDLRRYVHGVYVDDVLHEAGWIDHATLLGAQTLRFDLRSTPPR